MLTPAPVPTAAPQFRGVTPARDAAVNDTLYWNGTAWVNAGPLPEHLAALPAGLAHTWGNLMTSVFTDFYRTQLFASLDQTAPIDPART